MFLLLFFDQLLGFAIEVLEPDSHLRQKGALGVIQLLPAVEIDQHAGLAVVEARVDAVLGLLLNADVEQSDHRPHIAVEQIAFERGVDLARRDIEQRLRVE